MKKITFINQRITIFWQGRKATKNIDYFAHFREEKWIIKDSDIMFKSIVLIRYDIILVLRSIKNIQTLREKRREIIYEVIFSKIL